MSNKVKIKLYNNLEDSIESIKSNTLILIGFDRIRKEEFNDVKTYTLKDLDRLVITEGCKNINIILNTYAPLKSILISKLNFYSNMYNVNFKVYVEYYKDLSIYDKFKKYDVIVEKIVV